MIRFKPLMAALSALLVLFALSSCGRLAFWRTGKPAEESPAPEAAVQVERPTPAESALPETRHVEIMLRARVKSGKAPAGAVRKLWMPYPISGSAQRIYGAKVIAEVSPILGYDNAFGNAVLFARDKVTEKRRELEIRVQFRADVTAWRPCTDGTFEVRKTPAAPVHPALTKSLEKAKLQTETREKARMIAQGLIQIKEDHTPSSVEAATRFACAMRKLGVPARVSTGFLLPIYPAIGTRAIPWCWAEYLDAGKWHPVDPAAMRKTGRIEPYLARLPPDRVRLGVGEEIMLEPPQTAGIIKLGGVACAEIAGKAVSAVWEATYRDTVEGR